MCPNHVEHFLDSNLVSSTSVTERLKIWQKYARTPVNPDSVRLEFFRKVRTGKLFRSSRTAKIIKPIESRIRVPGYVKRHYENRVKPFPIEESENLLTPIRQNEPFNLLSENTNRDLSADEKDWLLSVISLQTSILKMDVSASSDKKDEKFAEKVKHFRRRKKTKETPEKKTKKSLTNGDAEMSSDHSDDGELSDAGSVSTASECSLGLDNEDEQVLSSSTQDELREYLAAHAKAGDVDLLDSTVLKFLAAKKLNEIFPKPIQVITSSVDSKIVEEKKMYLSYNSTHIIA